MELRAIWLVPFLDENKEVLKLIRLLWKKWRKVRKIGKDIKIDKK